MNMKLYFQCGSLPLPLSDSLHPLPSQGHGGGQLGQRDFGWGGDETDPLIASKWSSATLRILSSMPSRTIGESRGENTKVMKDVRIVLTLSASKIVSSEPVNRILLSSYRCLLVLPIT